MRGSPALGAAIFILGCPSETPLEADDNVVGCGANGGDEVGYASEETNDQPSFEEYVAEHVVALPEGGWAIEGDIYTLDEGMIQHAYANAIGPSLNRETQFRATAACDPFLQVDSIWDPATKLALTYCLDESWDAVPELVAILIPALERAANAWESAGDLNFIHADVAPSDCIEGKNGIVFNVKHVKPCQADDSFCYNALAFFSFMPADYRTLNIRATALAPDQIDRILAHELGHILGMWHEHARYPQIGVPCATSVGTPADRRGVTKADVDSVMGYPLCAGTDPHPPHPSTLDKLAIEYLNNLPRGDTSKTTSQIVWHQPDTASRTIWTPTPPGQPIEFTTNTQCWLDDCGSDSAKFWRPLALDITRDGELDVLMYGPGAIPEQLHSNIGGVDESAGQAMLTSDNAAVPWIIDDLLGAQSSTIWWQRPGLNAEQLWQATTPQTWQVIPILDFPTFGGFFMGAVGRFSDITDETQVLWYSPHDASSYLAFRDEDAMDGIDSLAVYPVTCGLVEDRYYDRLPGNFDDDEEHEIFWYEPETGTALVWWSVLGCLQPGQTTVAELGIGKPLVGHFRDDGRDDILLYQPSQHAVSFYNPEIDAFAWSRPIAGDTSPFVDDFDGDGCADVLWFAPSQPQSEIWRSDCAGGFVVDVPVSTIAGYPLGFGSGHGRLPYRSF